MLIAPRQCRRSFGGTFNSTYLQTASCARRSVKGFRPEFEAYFHQVLPAERLYFPRRASSEGKGRTWRIELQCKKVSFWTDLLYAYRTSARKVCDSSFKKRSDIEGKRSERTSEEKSQPTHKATLCFRWFLRT